MITIWVPKRLVEIDLHARQQLDDEHGQCQVEAWTNVRTVAAGERHTVALCADGRVLAVGDDSAGQCDVTEWKLW